MHCSVQMRVQTESAEDADDHAHPVECELCEVKVKTEFVDDHFRWVCWPAGRAADSRRLCKCPTAQHNRQSNR